MSYSLAWLDDFYQKKGELTLHKAILQHIELAIEKGVLKAGDKLPPQRKFSSKLKIATATVTKAYNEAELNGLITSKVGKGSFVSSCPTLHQAIKANDFRSINLSIIKPQVNVANKQITEQVKILAEQSQLSDLMDYNVAGGSVTDHQAADFWLSSQNINLSHREVALCSGAQHGLMVLINTLTEYGDCIAVEELCYPGIISLANQFGRKLIPVKLDDEGIVPSSLESVCKQHDIKALIVVASHQNPTATSMTIKRRKAIANIVKQNKIWLIDDDVYGFLSPKLPPISNFTPDYGFYLTSLSKSIFPGLRVGYLVFPEAFKQRVEATIRNTIWMPVPISLALASKLIFSGQALAIQKKQNDIAIQRQKIAKRILKGEVISSQANSFHLWLTLPQQWNSKSFCEALEDRGVLVSSSEYFRVDDPNNKSKHINNSTGSSIRISLMAAKSEDELKFALNKIKALLQKHNINLLKG